MLMLFYPTHAPLLIRLEPLPKLVISTLAIGEINRTNKREPSIFERFLEPMYDIYFYHFKQLAFWLTLRLGFEILPQSSQA
jgi:hypothetical protein